MSAINEVREQTYKLIIAGPVGAGKTAAIQVLSDKGVVTTDEVASDDTKLIKKTTTVAMDYGVMILDSGEQVRLYGTPGQRRFDFMWEILSENDLDYYLDAFSPLIKSSALVVGVTHAENMPWDLHETLSKRLMERGVGANVMIVDARDREQMRRMVRSLIYMIAS